MRLRRELFSLTLAAFAGCLLLPWKTAGQTTEPHVIHQSQYWFRFYGQCNFRSGWSLHLELDERRSTNPDLQANFLMHVHLHHRVNKYLDWATGASAITTNSTIAPTLAVPERRLFQEISFTQPFGSRLSGQLRLRVDERFIQRNNRVVLSDGYNFSVRERLRAQLSYRIKEQSTAILKLSDELMVHQGSTPHFFDQNRIYTAVEWPLGGVWSVETGIVHVYQARSDDGYASRMVFRFTLYGRWSAVSGR
ncbi:MAG: DUF2490 domain-containing protein [Cyclobacteriaceae bacterium]|nr:DUF2490 domain-containing protein [Cyclobacteriaceae bacterium]